MPDSGAKCADKLERNAAPPGRGGKRAMAGAALLLALGALGAMASGKGRWQRLARLIADPTHAEAAEPAVTVFVQKAAFESDSRPHRFVAVLRARIQTALSFQVAGKVSDRLVSIRDRVHAGEVLARLSTTDFQLRLDQATAEVKAATQALSKATEDETRATSLRTAGYGSQAVQDAARSTAQEALARLEQARAQVKIAQNALANTTLRAEADGVVLNQMLESGQVVAAGQTVIEIAVSGALEAEVHLPETIPKPAATARFTPWSQPGKAIAAYLRELSPIADAATHTFTARYTLDGTADAELSPGMTGQLEIAPAGRHAPLLRVPSTAIYDPGMGQGPGIWRVGADQRLAFVPVSSERLQGTYALVEAAVQPGDRIVTLGADRLQAGQKVDALDRSVD